MDRVEVGAIPVSWLHKGLWFVEVWPSTFVRASEALRRSPKLT